MSYPLPSPRRRARFARCTAGSRLIEGLESRRLLAAPIADAGGPYTAFEGDTLNLDASASSDVDNDIVSYTWTIGSGANSFQAFGVTPSIDYSELVTAGIGDGPLAIDISVLVEDSANNTDTSQTTLTLNNSLPNVGVNADGSNVYKEGQVVLFEAIAGDLTTDPGDLIYTWTAHLDATLLDTAAGPFSTFAVTLPDQGNLTVTVSVEDSDGESSTANFTQFISNVLPVVNFISPSPGTVTEGDVINVFVDASDAADPSLQYRVAVAKQIGASFVTQFTTSPVFGIGGMSIPISALDEGTWRFQARVEDDVGGTNSAVRTFTVVNAAPAPTISGVPAGDVDVGDEITLTVDPNDPGTLDTHTYAWTVTRDGDVIATGSDDFITFTADEAGTYEYSVIVTDNAAAPGSASGSFDAVEDVADQAEIAYSGLQHITTDSLSDTTAQINLRATLTDMGADAADIGSAMVSFSVFHPVAGLVYSSQAGVSSTDGMVGVATSSFIYTLGGSAAALTVVVEVMGGGYTADSLSVPLTVSRAETGRVVGAGLMLNTNSGGLLAAESGTRTLFAFTARKTSGSISGVFSMTYEGADGNVYLVVSDDVTSLFTWTAGGVKRAAMSAEADVYNIRRISGPSLVHSNLTLEMTLTDAGNYGQFDRASFAVWNGTGLVFGSYIDPVTNSVTEQLLSAGNISIWES